MSIREEIRAQAAASPAPEPLTLRGKTFAESKKIIMELPEADVRGLAIALMIQQQIADKYSPQAERVALLEGLLRELYALVWGECPALLDETRGGDSRLDERIRAALGEG